MKGKGGLRSGCCFEIRERTFYWQFTSASKQGPFSEGRKTPTYRQGLKGGDLNVGSAEIPEKGSFEGRY